jgi:Ran GTPase-activating protein (RanGAP) involved in mRNA processing and transport
LLSNQIIEEIILASNDIDDIGCFVLCRNACDSTSLRKLDLSENPIGKHGCHMVVSAIKNHGDRLEINIRNCDVLKKYSSDVILNIGKSIIKYIIIFDIIFNLYLI